jgi:DMSO/TMAO reductase YedYZ molybdopterin-dependent catalytic subunit
MAEGLILTVEGLVEREKSFSMEDLDALPLESRVPDVSQYHANRRGAGVILEAILAIVKPLPQANHLTLHADRDDFHVSIPLDAVRGEGIVVYRDGDSGLAVKDGGPVRFLIRDPSACHTSELDDCANVKYLSRMELAERKGRDTRPVTEDAHEALHREQDRSSS